MKYCIHCGEKMEEDATFCTNCGEPAEQSSPAAQTKQPATKEKATVSSSTAETDTSRSANQNKPPKSKRKKILTSIIAIIIFLCIGSYFVINTYILSPEAVADQFMDGVEENDTSKVQHLINDALPSLNASEKEVDVFLQYLNDQPKVLSEVSSELNTAIEDPIEEAGQVDDESLVTIQKNGKKWLLFDHYAIEVVPMFLEIELPDDLDDEIKLFVNDKEEDLKNKNTVNIGPTLPGVHQVTAEMDGEYGKITNEKTADFSETGAEALVEFDFQQENYVSIYSDNDDASIYVNDEDSKQKVKDSFDNGFGPLPKDGSIELHAEKKFSKGTKKSDPITIDEDTEEADLTLGYDDYDEEFDTDSEDDDSKDDESDIEDIITSHYEDISDEEYDTAYDYFSDSKMDEYNLDTWSKDLKNTIEDEVVSVEVEDVSTDEAEASVEMISREKDGEDIQVREWEGTWGLITEDGDWKLDEADLEEKDSYTE